jgi:serine/threonine protein kinase/class 3 adenylate cyclase
MADDTQPLARGSGSGGPRPLASELGRGDVIGGRWRLEEFLTSGGMGRVWRATDLHLAESVAIKVMDPALIETENARARFMREAQAAAKLRGPNVVAVLDFDVDEQRRVPYMAMELLRGEDLARRLSRGPLGYLPTLAVIADVCVAIRRAHRLQIVHRDLKPANVFLVDDDGGGPIAKVLDFGIVKLGLDLVSDESHPLTRSGAMLGTLRYMSPEQLDNAQTVDQRADLWSIAAITYECLTGRRPFDGATLGPLIMAVRSCNAPAPSSIAEVPRGFDAWFARATNRDLNRRFATADELLDSLRALGERKQSRSSKSAEEPQREREREPGHGPLESWASDANQIDIRALEDITFKNSVVHEFLDSGNKHFVSGSKGLGKTLLLTYKRFLLSEQYQTGAVKFVPEGRPYLDMMGDLPSMSQAGIDLMTALDRCKRIWGFGFRLSAVSHHPALISKADNEDLQRFPRRLRALLEGRQAEPTMVVKELLSLSVGQINRVIDETENFLEHKIRSFHSGMYMFVDKLDQALRQLPREAWVHMQAGMIEAAWDLMNTNRHIKIFATIREEAFASYQSDIKTNLFGATSTLRYSKHDLRELLEKLTFFYEQLPLRDFVILDVVSTTRGIQSEAAFDFMARHTLGRPRDLVIVASEISRHRRSLDERSFKRIVQETSASMLVANVFDEMRVFLEVLCDRDQRTRFLATLPYNVLTHNEVVDLWCRFHGVEREYYDLHGHDAAEAYHPFRELYDCGLLGVVARDPGSGRRTQRFRQPHDAVAGSQRQLPRSREYLLHPALEALVVRLTAGGSFTAFRHVVIGHGEPWPRHYGPIVEVQRELARRADRFDEDTEDAVYELLARLDGELAIGQPFEDARKAIARSPAFVRLTARLERLGADELHLALLELFSPDPERSGSLLGIESIARTEPQWAEGGRADVAMLLIDIVKSTRMLVERGDTHFIEHLRAMRETLRLGDEHQAPRLIKGTGDGYLAVYDTVAAALDAARRLRQELGATGLRMVIHRGRVRVGSEDVLGSEVHRIFRLESLDEEARIGGHTQETLPVVGRVLLSRSALGELPAEQRVDFVRVGAFALQGFDEPEEIWVER